ncbi:MAG TPA: hypothetical protein VKP68_01285 [Ramlibacter sp.]|nr:hypothetical protein [Ramlibacter sp.]
MKTRWTASAAAVLLALAPTAWACGVCVEDKVAATYDHAVVQRAAAAGKAMVYCEIHGSLDARRWQSAARRVRGLDPASVRVSSEPAAISFALDTSRQSPQAAAAALQQALPGSRVAIVRLITSKELSANAAGH